MALAILPNEGTVVLGTLAVTSSDFGFVSTVIPSLSEFVSLIGTGSNVQDMVVEDREAGFDVSGSLSADGKAFRSVELGNSQGKDSLGGDGASEPDAFLRINNRMGRDSIQIKAFGSPGKQESQIRFRPGCVHAEFDEILLKLISSKLGSSRFTVAFDKVGVGGRSFTGS